MTTKWKRPAIYALLGGAAGFAYYYFIGCASGTCPITGNPYVSTMYGAFMGTVVGWPKTVRAEKSEAGENGEGKS